MESPPTSHFSVSQCGDCQWGEAEALRGPQHVEGVIIWQYVYFSISRKAVPLKTADCLGFVTLEFSSVLRGLLFTEVRKEVKQKAP